MKSTDFSHHQIQEALNRLESLIWLLNNNKFPQGEQAEKILKQCSESLEVLKSYEY